jgi:Det1 complexing ubiquitin ligase
MCVLGYQWLEAITNILLWQEVTFECYCVFYNLNVTFFHVAVITTESKNILLRHIYQKSEEKVNHP